MKPFHHSVLRNKTVIGVIAAVIMSIVLYWYTSVSAWNAMAQRVEVYEAQTSNLTDTFFATKGASSDQRRTAIKKLAEPRTLSCVSDVASGWQTAINKTYKDRQEKCNEALLARTTLAAKAASVERFYHSLDSISISIVKLSVPDKSVPATLYQSKLDTVQSVLAELTEITAKDTAPQEVRTEALTATKKIESAWISLIAAHKKEDKAAFLKAEDSLATAYGSLSAVTKVAHSGYVQLTNELSTRE